MINSPAYLGLSPNARSLLEQIQTLENGSNNGQIFLSVRDATARMGLSDTKAGMAAFDQLIEHGFLAITKPGSFRVKASASNENARATCYRLTWLPWPSASRPATNEWKSWKPTPDTPPAKRLLRVMKTNLRWGIPSSCVEECTTPGAIPPLGDALVVEDTSTQVHRFGRNAGDQVRADSPTHAISQPGRATKAACAKLRATTKEWLAAKGFGSQKRLARIASICESTLSRFLSDDRGRRTLPLDQFMRLERAVRPEIKTGKPPLTVVSGGQPIPRATSSEASGHPPSAAASI